MIERSDVLKILVDVHDGLSSEYDELPTSWLGGMTRRHYEILAVSKVIGKIREQLSRVKDAVDV